MVRYVVLLGLLVATPALAANWIKVTTSSSGGVMSYDLDSVKSEYKVVNVWVRWDYTLDKTQTARLEKNKMVIRCATNELQVAYAITYNAAGDVLATSNTPYSSFSPIVPDSVGEILAKALCKDL